MDLESEPVYSLPIPEIISQSAPWAGAVPVYLVHHKILEITEISIPVKILRVLRLLSVRVL